MPTSPGGSVKSHRFERRSPRSPRSPGSPPMSARTFATFFSSSSSQANYSPREPYSPQAPSHFSGSTLAGSPEPTPSLPPIPQFEKVQFEKTQFEETQFEKTQFEKVPLFDNLQAVHAKRRSRSTPTSPVTEPGTVNIDEKLPKIEKKETEKEKEKELETPSTAAKATDAPAVDPKVSQDDQVVSSGSLTKLSRRILAVLSSKSAEKAEAKRRSKEAAQQDLDRLENVHWTDL